MCTKGTDIPPLYIANHLIGKKTKNGKNINRGVLVPCLSEVSVESITDLEAHLSALLEPVYVSRGQLASAAPYQGSLNQKIILPRK